MRTPSWRTWTVSLSAVVLAVAGTTVALQSASGQPSTSPTMIKSIEQGTPTTTAAVGAPSAAAPACSRKATKKARAKVTSVKLPSRVKGYGSQGDTETLPMAIASAPNGRSWLVWVGTDEKVYLGRLGCNDKLIGKPTSFKGIDLQDVKADSRGGVLLITKKGNCGSGPLCGGTSSPCNTMHMIRFDNSGKLVWDRQVTNLTSSRKGYSDGARFVWWYQHHGRLASDGKNYAAYFGTAITVKNGNCVDIHEGDRMQVVNPTGKILKGKSVDVGCSHAWTSRIVYDPAKKKFVMTCATDNECRIAQPNPYRTVAAGTCDGTLFGGDLVLAKTGCWTAWSQGGQARLSRFTTGRANKTVRPGVATAHPHLVKYGKNRMLIGWGSGAKTKVRVLSRSTGATLGSTLTLGVREHDYTAFKEYRDGSVAYPAAGATSTSIRIARILPMS